MKTYKRILGTIAKKYKLDPDILLLALWDYDEDNFQYLKNENSRVKNHDYRSVKQLILSRFLNKETLKKDPLSIKTVEIVMKEHDFSKIGKNYPSIKYISREEVLRIYDELVKDFTDGKDPIEPSGLKNPSLLDSALFHATTSYEDKFKYPTIESAAAALMYALSHNHAFHNGNKRTAMVAMLVFLDRHNTSLLCDEDELFRISLKLADHKLVEPMYLYPDAEIEFLAYWIHSNSKIMIKGERPITLKKFRQILSHFDCTILENGRVQRKVPSSFLGLKTSKPLVSRRAIGKTLHEGDEVEMGLIKSIRDDLQLNATHSIDSEVFYERAKFTTSDFINKYRSLLKRLSKV